MMFTKKDVLRGIILLTGSFVCSVSQAESNPAVLFSDAQGARPQKITPSISGVHTMYARANIGFLFDKTVYAKDKDKLSEIRLDFFPGVNLVGRVSYLEPTPSLVAGLGHWEGELINVAGDFSITVSLRKNSRLLFVAANLDDGRSFSATCDENFICQIDGKTEPTQKSVLPVNP